MDDAREQALRGTAARREKHVTLIIARSCGRFEICGRRGISRELSRSRAGDSRPVNIARIELAPDFWKRTHQHEDAPQSLATNVYRTEHASPA